MLNNSYCTNGKDIISLPSLMVLPLSCYIMTGVSTFQERHGSRVIFLGLALVLMMDEVQCFDMEMYLETRADT